MVWTYEQLFNGLNNGNLHGQDFWTETAPGAFVVQEAVKYEGAKAVKVDGNNNQATRDLTNGGHECSSGIVYFAMRLESLVVGQGFVTYFRDSQPWAVWCQFALRNDAGTYRLRYYGGAGAVNVAVISLDTWYIIAVEFDKDHGGAGVHQFRFKWMEDGGSWSAWSAWINDRHNTNGTVDKIYIDMSGVGVGYFDTFTPTDPTISVETVKIEKTSKYCVIKTPSAKTKSLKYTVVKEHAAIEKSLKYDIFLGATNIQKSLQYSINMGLPTVTTQAVDTIEKTTAMGHGTIVS